MKAAHLFLFALLGSAVPAESVKFAVTISDSSGREFVANIVFDGDRALEFGAEISAAPLAIFDLSAAAWTDTATSKRVTLSEARAWAEAAKARALASLDRVTDPDQREFVQQLINSAFTTEVTTDGISLKSRFLSYTASEPVRLDEELRRRIALFEELNAYRRAMAPRQPPPFTQLEVARLLAQRGIFPGLLVMDLTTPNGSVTARTRYAVLSLSAAEQSLLDQSR